MKVSLQQVTLPTTNTTFNITDAGITSDFQGLILFGGAPTADGTTTAGMNYWIGACDAAGRMGYIASGAQDATSGAAESITSGTSFCSRYNNGASLSTQTAYSATLSNGMALATTGTVGTAFKTNALMIAGSDTQFAVSSGTLSGTSITITHNLTVVPSAVILLASSANASLNNSGVGGPIIGFWDGTNSAGFGGGIVSAANPTSVGARCGTADMGHAINQTPADQYTLSIGSVGASTLKISSTASVTAGIVIIAIGSSSTAAASAFVNTTPTATGANAVNSGMSVAPQLWLNVSTRLTSTAFANTDNAGSWGFAAAVNNNGTTQQCAIGASFENGVSASSVAKTYNSNSTASQTLTDAGALNFASTVSTWNSGGITENVSATDGNAYERINLVYGIAPAAAPTLPLALFSNRRNQIFPIPT
jgi:hypothetical protein